MTTRDIKTGYSTAELAALKAPGFPGSREGIRDRANREGWASIEVPGRGGKNGTRRDYLFASLPQALKDAIVAKASAPQTTHFERYYDVYIARLLDAQREAIERLIREIERVIL